MLKTLPVFAVLLAGSAAQAAPRPLPTSDKEGSADSPLIKRYSGSIILSYEHKHFEEFTLPLAPLERVPEKKDNHNNNVFAPKKSKPLEGAYTHIVYLLPPERSPLEVLRNYQDEVKDKDGAVLFQCKGRDCGGDPTGNVMGGGGNMSLGQFLYPAERVTDPFPTIGWCANAGNVVDVRYMAAELPAQGAHLSVLTLTLPDPDGDCALLRGRTIARVDIIEGKARENKMTTVQSAEMAQAISSVGKIALYGIYFDPNKSEIKPTSAGTLEQIGKLLKDSPKLKLLVVGHTDNQGTFAANTDLSQRRAAAVVSALSERYGVKRDRLTPVGVSSAAPVGSNKTEEGRAKNRRVELVEN